MTNKTSPQPKLRNRSNQVPLAGCTTPIRDQTVGQRFTAIGFEPDDFKGCWEWQGRLNEAGYGVLTLARAGLHEAKVHRIAWEFANGKIPDGSVVRHLVCDNPMCARPSHLALGSQAANVTDMFTAGRQHAGHTLLAGGARYADGSRCATCRQTRKIEEIHTEVRRAAKARFAALADAA